MPRPTDEQLRAWCIRSATAERGTCNAESAYLFNKGWTTLAKPKDKGRYHLFIDLGSAQDHHAFYAQWEGDDGPVVIDNTIAQFGGDAMVFIGSKEEWMAEIKRLTNARSVKEDDRHGTLFNAAFEAELERNAKPKTAIAKEQQRKVPLASQDVHENRCLKSCAIQ